MPSWQSTPMDYFLSRIEYDTIGGCWLWRLSIKCGYGQASVKRHPMIASRLMWMVANQRDVPKGKIVCHRCDIPSCVNPAHLWLGTNLDNSRDRDAKGRGSRLRGTTNPMAVLTDDKVREIRRRRSLGETQDSLSAAFGIAQGQISQIVRRRRWTHV